MIISPAAVFAYLVKTWIVKFGGWIREAKPAGNQYSLRYEEALCMEAAYQRRRADRAEARIKSLEERLSLIESKLNIS